MCAKIKPDYLARLDGATDLLWEPLWQLQIALRPVEHELLTSPALRRLHFIHHAGAAYLSTPHTYSRLQHTLGVFALVAHFCPDDTILRVAALLHDIGHAPFSHTLEQLPDVDHHRWTIERVLSSPLVDILERHYLDPHLVLTCIDGHPANPLRNPDNILQLDHLDSWVRSAQAGGILPVPAPQILSRLRLQQAYIDTDLNMAELLVALIIAEAHFHCSEANLGVNTMLQHLVRRGLEAGAFSIKDLARMNDATVEHLLLDLPGIADEARRLWYQPHDLVVSRLESGNSPPDAHLIFIDRLYLAVPLANGQPVTKISAQAAKLMAETQKLTGSYVVAWADQFA
jgi:HD superfamily phosphohydrolase